MEIDIPTLLSALGMSSAAAAWIAKALINQKLEERFTKFKTSYEAEVKKDVEVFLREKSALLEYESEAKKRLYLEIGPLKYQLMLAARDYQARVENHAYRSYSLNISEHYGKSTAYRLARLLCLCELIESRITYADFSVDKSAIQLLIFKKTLYILLSGSKITLRHPNNDWNSQKEHLFYDTLSTIGNSLITNNDSSEKRCMTFNEFSDAIESGKITNSIQPLINILENLENDKSPILWLRLSCIGALCNSLLEDLGAEVGFTKKKYNLKSTIISNCDKYIEKKIDEYIQTYKDIKKEGL